MYSECSTPEFLNHNTLCTFEQRLLQTFTFYLRDPVNYPDFLFQILIEEGQRLITVFNLTQHWAYRDAF